MSRNIDTAILVSCFLLVAGAAGAEPTSTAKPVTSAQEQPAERSQIPVHSPEWTDARPGDPGRSSKPADETAGSVRFGDGQRGTRLTGVKAKTGTLSLCCGSVDTESNAGLNCAKLAAGKTCGGDILSCPPNCEEHVGEDGTGGCYCP